MSKLVECPRCGEADERHLGRNVCGLCECRFWVRAGRPVFAPESAPLISAAVTAPAKTGDPSDPQ